MIELCPECRSLKPIEGECPVCRARVENEMISLGEYFGDRRDKFASEFRPEYAENAKRLLKKINDLLDFMASARPSVKWTITSGWRPPSVNAKIGGAPRSRHVTAEAIDFLDDEKGSVADYFVCNPRVLSARGLAMEDPRWCVKRQKDGKIERWIHLQGVLPRSGRTVFQPFPGEPPTV